jgi:hypothetical protein
MDADYRQNERAWRGDPTSQSKQMALWLAQRRIGLRLDDNEPGKIPTCFDGYDWTQAFGACGGSDSYISQDIRPAVPGSSVSLEPFDRTLVRRIFRAVDGEHDAANWEAAFELWDGRLASLSAGCDYTGWD